MFIVRRSWLSKASSRACHSGVNGNNSVWGLVGVIWGGGPRSGPARAMVRAPSTRVTARGPTRRATAQSGSGLGLQPASAKPDSAIIVIRTLLLLPEVDHGGMVHADTRFRKGMQGGSRYFAESVSSIS